MISVEVQTSGREMGVRSNRAWTAAPENIRYWVLRLRDEVLSQRPKDGVAIFIRREHE